MQRKVEFKPNDKDAFAIEENGQRIAEMIVSIEGNTMQIYHTGVNEDQKGKGLGKQLVNAMAEYARQNRLKVNAHCPFVQAQFKENPDTFGDIIKAD